MKRIVLTGAPSSGKTTLIEEFSKMGFCVIQEQARAYIEESLSNGFTLSEIRADKTNFQYQIFQRNLAVERNLDQLISDNCNYNSPYLFGERAIPDTMGFCLAHGLEIKQELIQAIQEVKYDFVFLLEPLSFEQDDVRDETLEEQLLINEGLKEAYSEFDIIEIPVLSVQERVHYILNLLSGMNK